MADPLALRRGVATLHASARRDLFMLWRKLSESDSAESMLQDVLPGLIDAYGLAAATLAADWYDDLRAAASPKGRFRAIPADIPDSGAGSLIGWAANEAAKPATMQTLILGGTQRRISNFARQTVTDSSTNDPQSAGWKRIGAGGCDFCQILITRDTLYSEATADFASHDHCNCQAYPIINGAEPIDVKDYVQSKRNAQNPGESDAAYEKRRAPDRERVRDYIATH